MERGRNLSCFVFAVMPILCLGMDTRLMSGLKNGLRTENNSYDIYRKNDQIDRKQKYFDVLYRFVQSNRDTFVPDVMQRTLRSLESYPLLTSIKREKELYENLNNLQYYGSEIPKKFTEKRLLSLNYLSERNTQHKSDKKQNLAKSNYSSDRKMLKREMSSGLQQESNHNSFKSEYQTVSVSPFLSNIPILSDSIQQLETSVLKEATDVANFTSQPFDGKNIDLSKRRFQLPRSEENICNMDDLDIDISFRETMETDAGFLLLTCSGSIVVKKCEGACISQVKPSVNNYDGFERVCCVHKHDKI